MLFVVLLVIRFLRSLVGDNHLVSLLGPSQQNFAPPATPILAAPPICCITPKLAPIISVMPLRIEPPIKKPSPELSSEPPSTESSSEPAAPIDSEQYMTITFRELLARVQRAQELSELLSSFELSSSNPSPASDSPSSNSPSFNSSSAPQSSASAPTALTLGELLAKA